MPVPTSGNDRIREKWHLGGDANSSNLRFLNLPASSVNAALTKRPLCHWDQGSGPVSLGAGQAECRHGGGRNRPVDGDRARPRISKSGGSPEIACRVDNRRCSQVVLITNASHPY
jgi:hypothetical protein